MKLHKLILLLPTLFSFMACSKCYNIEGKLSVNRYNGRKIYLKSYVDGAWQKVDSAEIIHHAFKIDGEVDSMQMVSLFIDDYYVLPFVLECGDIDIDLSETSVKVSGTKLNEKLYSFIKEEEVDIDTLTFSMSHLRALINGDDLNNINEYTLQKGAVDNTYYAQ